MLDSFTNCQFQEGNAVCAIQLVYFLWHTASNKANDVDRLLFMRLHVDILIYVQEKVRVTKQFDRGNVLYDSSVHNLQKLTSECIKYVFFSRCLILEYYSTEKYA